MYVIIIAPKGAPSAKQVIGSFDHYSDAESALCAMPVAAECEFKYVEIVGHTFDRAAFEAAKPENYMAEEAEWAAAEPEQFEDPEDRYGRLGQG